MDEKTLDALERLARLKADGSISEAEFEAQKHALLARELASGDPAQTSDQPVSAPSAAGAGYAQPGVGGDEIVTPVWSRKKKRQSPLGIALLLLAIFGTALGSAMWFLNRTEYQTHSFMATGPANVRDAPNATEGRVVAQLAQGDFITGRVQGSADKQWVRVSEGRLRGGFVWAGNLASEGPDDVLGATGDRPPFESQDDPMLAALMSRHQVGGGTWSAVSSIAPEHEGRYSLACALGGPEFRGRRMDVWWDGRIDQTDTYDRIYRSGSRYIQIIGQTYFVRDFASGNMRGLETIVSGRNVPVDQNIRVPRCSAGSQNTISRAELFTPSGLTNASNIPRAHCGDVIAAKYALTCAATILNNMPNASSAPAVRRSLLSAQQESSGRCASQARRVGSAGDLIVQQNVGDVYETIAGQAVYGGDVSDAAISLCIREIVGSMSSAGFLTSGGRQAGVAEDRPIASRASSGQAVRDAEATARYAREVAAAAARDAQAAALAAENQARRNGG